MERRRYDRHDVHLPVLMDGGEGLTRDMSLSGAYIETPALAVPVGQTFDFSVTVGHDEQGSWTLRCQGLVIRVERQGDRIGIAVSIDRFLEINSNMNGTEKDH